MLPTPEQLADFHSCIDKRGPDECHPWKFKKKKRDTYGRITFDGVTYGAHRLILTLKLGRSIKKRLQANHSCGNKWCCNPNHIYEGTHRQNMADMVQHGGAATGERNGARLYPERLARGHRSGYHLHPESYPKGDDHYSRQHPEKVARGERVGTANLTDGQAAEIVGKYKTGHYSQRDLAREYGVYQSTVWRLLNAACWRHINSAPIRLDDDQVSSLYKEHKPKGEQSHFAKLNEETVRQIRRLYSTGDFSMRALADKFDIGPSQVSRIVKGQSWAHIRK